MSQCAQRLSVLFNEPKLLKNQMLRCNEARIDAFSALQRAEIAEKATMRSLLRN